MKRVHRRWHRRAWLLVTPAAAVVLWLALVSRADMPANADFPAFLKKALAKGSG
jgi:hypothetical protein